MCHELCHELCHQLCTKVSTFFKAGLALTSNQLVFFTYFKQIMEAGEEFPATNITLDESRPDWKRYPMVLGKPGTGKILPHSAVHCLCFTEWLTTCVATPTGT